MKKDERDGQRMVICHYSIRPDQKELIEELAKRQDRSKSNMLRQIIDRYIAEQKLTHELLAAPPGWFGEAQ